MSEDLDVADVLERAADLLFVHGRAKGQGVDSEGRLCVRGALCVAVGEQPEAFLLNEKWRPADRALARYLNDHPDVIRDDVWKSHVDEPYTTDGFPTWIWNDTTRGEAGDELVIDTLRRCAKDLRA